MIINKNYIKTLIITLSLFTISCNYKIQKNISGQTMGTFYNIKYITNKKNINPQKIQTNIKNRLEKINNQMSTYQSDSEITRFNKFKKINTPFIISDDTATVIKKSIEINKITNGSLDITIGPLVNL